VARQTVRHPYRSAEGFFDVVAGDRETARRGLRALLAHIRETGPLPKSEAIAEFGVPFWRLEPAALRLETPESFRSEEGRESFALLTEVRQALTGRRVRDRGRMKPMKRNF
jgi:hypothetical protein